MSRHIRISMFVFLLIVLYFGVSLSINGCKGNNENAEAPTSTEKQNEQIGKDVEQIADEFFESGSSAEGEKTTAGTQLEQKIVENQNAEPPVESDPIFDTKKSSPNEPENKQPAAIKSNAKGKYLIIAGNYLMESNAKQMVSKLKKLGYQDAEYLVFDLSQYYTVCAQRSDNRNSLKAISNKLKNSGIDNYIHTQQN